MNPFSIVSVHDHNLQIIVDSKMTEDDLDSPLAFHTSDPGVTIFVKIDGLMKFVESAGFTHQLYDFSSTTTHGDQNIPSTAPKSLEKKHATATSPTTNESIHKETKIGLEVGKTDDFSLWYQQVRYFFHEIYSFLDCEVNFGVNDGRFDYLVSTFMFHFDSDALNFFGLLSFSIMNCFN